MFNPKSKADLDQLSLAMGYSWECLSEFRETRKGLMRDFVGKHYNNGTSEKRPINLMELAINIYLQQLVGNAPAVSAETNYPQLYEICDRLELAGDHLVKEINLEDTLARGVVAAIFCMGIVKTGLNATQVEIGGYLHDSGQPFANTVSMDNWIHDMTADRIEECQYMGDRYPITEDEAKELLTKEQFKKLVGDDERQPVEEAHNISEGSATKREEFRRTYKVWDIWLPKQGVVLICADSGDDSDPIGELLKVVKWNGREKGPYHLLGFSFLDDNTMPVAPASLWKDLNDLENKLFTKLGRQADRQKTVTFVQRGAEADGNRVIDADDGQTIGVDNADSVKEYSYGGINSESLGFLVHVKDLFSYLAGNLDILGGLGPQSETLGQDQMLGASASQRILKMQKAVYAWTKDIIEDLIYWLWTDPYIELPLVKRVPGFDNIAVPVTFSPEDREADFLSFNINIVPYSMQHQTPDSKLTALKNIFDSFIGPLMPMMQAQGVGINCEVLFKSISKLANLPELNEMLMYSNTDDQPEPVGNMPQKASQTKRTYERVNRPGATRQGKDQILQQALFGGKPQSSEAASVTRPTG